MRSRTTCFEGPLQAVPDASARVHNGDQRLTVGRELKMIVLKRQIGYLRKRSTSDRGERGDEH